MCFSESLTGCLVKQNRQKEHKKARRSGRGGEKMRITLETSGLQDVKELLENHERLISELHKNMNAISNVLIRINAKENQPMADTND